MKAGSRRAFAGVSKAQAAPASYGLQCATGVCRMTSHWCPRSRNTFAVAHQFNSLFLLQFPQLAPAGILLRLGGIRILLVFEPETKPVHGSTLRRHANRRIG